MQATVDSFRHAHARLAERLDQADLVLHSPDALAASLREIRESVLEHFRAKDAFYPVLADHLTARGDLAGAQLARIFEQNMKVQSAAVQRFFESLERVQSQQVADGYRTIAMVMRQRFSTEEKAVFPLTIKKEPRVKK